MPSRLRQLPNVVSSIRILLLFPTATALAHHRFVATLWLFAAAAATDGVDGFLARRFGWQTELGAFLDPVADKLLLATVFVMLTRIGIVPLWLTTAVLARDVIIVAGAIGYRILLGPLRARASIISKLNTSCQVAFIVLVIGTQQFDGPAAWTMVLGGVVFVTVVVSGIDYVLVYGRMAYTQWKARQPVARARGSKPA